MRICEGLNKGKMRRDQEVPNFKTPRPGRSYRNKCPTHYSRNE